MSKPTDLPFDEGVQEPVSNLILAAPDFKPEPLSNDQGEYSWFEHTVVGNDQGWTSSCAFQALANWAEIMEKKRISDEERLDVYFRALKREDRNSGGFTYPKAYYYADDAGWMPDDAEGIIPTRKLSTLAEQPILAGYSVHKPWNHVKQDGIISSCAGKLIAYHGVCINAVGMQGNDPTLWVYHEGSWGPKWGYKGMARLTGTVHEKTCREMWKVVFKGR